MGTGPYKAVSFQPDSKAVFTKSGTWWGGDTPAQTIEFDFFSDENARFLAQKNGTIDIATQLPIDQVSQFQGINGVNVLTESDRSYVGLTFDQNVEPFDDIHVRKAIAHAVDRSTIVSSILKGQATVATGIEPRTSWAVRSASRLPRMLRQACPSTPSTWMPRAPNSPSPRSPAVSTPS